MNGPPADGSDRTSADFQALRQSISIRLRKVCDGMSEEEFDALVLKIATFKTRWGESLVFDNPPALGAWMFRKDE